ncbi:MAG: invasion associated locus B family protein [Alphaproteobacteria bacterium]
MPRPTLTALLLATAGAAASPAAGQEYIETFTDWTAYHYEDQDGQGNTGQTCFMVSEAKSHSGPGDEPSHIYVTHRPWRNEVGIVSVDFGFEPSESGTIMANIGGGQFELKTWGTDLAWPYEGKDREMVNAMIRGIELVVTATASGGGATRDTFSLRGFSAAYAEIGRSCGVN